MQSQTKTLLLSILAVIVIAGIGIWWYSAGQHQTGNSATMTDSQTSPNQSNATDTMNSPSSPSNNSGVAQGQTSDAAIQANLSNADSQINGFSSDNTSINQGMSDQPVSQQ